MFLLLGMARSGTTLAQRLLVESGAIHIPRETHFWTDNQFLSSFHLMTNADIDAALDHLAHRDFDLSTQLESQLRDMSGETAWDFFTTLTRAPSQNGIALQGEKTPSHTRLIGKLHSEHPGLKSIVMVRDPRATFASHLSVSWGIHDSEEFVERWRRNYQEVLLALETYGPAQIKIIRLEDLVQETKHYIDSALSFLSVSAVDSGHKSIDPSVLASQKEFWKARSFGDIDNRLDNLFRFRLDPMEERRIWTSLSDLTKVMGY